jgi:hypothetical protein
MLLDALIFRDVKQNDLDLIYQHNISHIHLDFLFVSNNQYILQHIPVVTKSKKINQNQSYAFPG